MEKYWQSLDEYNEVPGIPEEKYEKDHKNAVLELFDEEISGASSSRRDFLKLFGFSLTSAAILSSCEKPVQKAIPYVIAPESITPGMSSYWATSLCNGKDFGHILVKTRDGRPIKIEANGLSSFNPKGTTARMQASVLSLYDDARIKNPLIQGEVTQWEQIDQELIRRLSEINRSGRKIVLLSSTLNSPSTIRLLEEFGNQFPSFQHVTYDAISYSGILTASREMYGKAIIPGYRFDRADVVVSFGADFLGSWIAPVHFIPAYASRRKLDEGQKDMLTHIQFESGLSLTGSNADKRIQIRPSEEKKILSYIHNYIASKKNSLLIDAPETEKDYADVVEKLLSAGSKSLVISGSNDPECQMLVNGINKLLGNYGVTIEFSQSLNVAKGIDNEMETLVKDMESGKVGAVMFHNADPLYDYHDPDGFLKALSNVELSLSFAGSANQTAAASHYVCPVHHFLESWDDAEIVSGTLSLIQPCIHPIFDTRSLQDSLLKWMGREVQHLDYIRQFWNDHYYPGEGSFTDWWNSCLQNGVFQTSSLATTSFEYNEMVLDKLSGNIFSEDIVGLELVLLESIQLGDGKYANNPWLQELPDPISKVSWDNVLYVSPYDAERFGVVNGDVVSLPGIEAVPVLIQAGQAERTCALALGYGRKNSGKVADGVGINAFPLVRMVNGSRVYFNTGISLQPTGKNVPLALSQTHNSMEGRPIVRSASLEEYLIKSDAGNELHEEFESKHKTLYPEVEFTGFHWGLAVDLNACVGCNSCVISCQAENNIPVVGKDEVFRRRIMHWIKIDRYYSGTPENPVVLFQPLMCQHCDNAPCENVCPVSATNHSSEGLNQMSYNRCIGTKYCINNCPYKVRRFNWYQYAGNKEFDFNINSDLGKMVLNPDVTVRERGVVEKCSFCVQRIQEKKLKAKLENRKLEDGEIETACVQACPAGALVFGDLNDPESRVSKLKNDPRNYHLLEELHTLPSVGYLTKIRNIPGESEKAEDPGLSKEHNS